ncbi:hypothetical protein KJ781_01580 [Patescibacteria group bacterium]|nr:hypothetical protein [Patescibacteria group bacterium]MBU1448917.1 hypothetical protein [Patescibacteria group bacterium]MBU2613250.1 hypothetical protein [Patescibacteria group bacterium]
MPIKRSDTEKKAPRRRRPVARKSTAASGDIPPRILSSEEKRELILAHAEARHPSDPVQRFSMWAGVAVCVTFVLVGWFSTLGSGIRSSLAGNMDPGVRQALEEGKRAMDEAPAFDQTVRDLTDRLQTAAAADAMVEELAAAMNATTTDGVATSTATRVDLFRPAPPTTTTITTTTTP